MMQGMLQTHPLPARTDTYYLGTFEVDDEYKAANSKLGYNPHQMSTLQLSGSYSPSGSAEPVYHAHESPVRVLTRESLHQMEESVDHELSMTRHQIDDFGYQYDQSILSFPAHPQMDDVRDSYQQERSIYYPLDLEQITKRNREMATKDNNSFSSEGPQEGEWYPKPKRASNPRKKTLGTDNDDENKRKKFLERNRIAGIT